MGDRSPGRGILHMYAWDRNNKVPDSSSTPENMHIIQLVKNELTKSDTAVVKN